ncbi:hypothetical protein [Legionella sp. PC997]|uniref:hypothetical protein n=1 Tax=Legionella sp. PC997 TaxID=2755562 RepID=UPI0015F92455|nr:hypothetical protein [Legionella sp. PC997]QMT60769.1 hypothetical protein HBNCFIEN_02153 [Legionella sp. PC997]
MPSSLQSNELSQWTQGEPDLIAKLLFNLFCFLKEATNKGKDTPEYKKIMDNIANFISLRGDQRLHIPQPSKAAIDASALLGAYLRLGIKLNDKPIVELSEEQIDIVHTFVKPLIPEGFTPQKFFDSLEGTPSQKHKKILHLLLFKDIAPQRPKELFEGKYADKVNNLLDSILNLADFMRTPFSVLPEEERAAVAEAKRTGKGQAQTSGIDLQWTSMCKAIEQSLQDIINLKKSKAKQALIFSDEIRASLEQCRKCFGIANARYEVVKEFAKEAKRHEEVLNETFQNLGFPQGNQEKINQYIRDFRNNLLEKEKDPKKAEALQSMTLIQLINVYDAQWRAAFDKIRKELLASQEELNKAVETSKQKMVALEESEKALKSLQQRYEHFTHEFDATVKKLDQQNKEVERLQKVESASKELIEKQKSEIEKTRSTVRQNSNTLEELRKQLQIVQNENNELKKKLISAQKHEQTIVELTKQLEILQREQILLQQQLKIVEQTTIPSSEVVSETASLKSELEFLRNENSLLLKRVEKGKQIQEPETDVIDLKTQLESLRQENAQLKELLLKKQPIPEPERLNQPVELPTDNIKPDLLIALGRLRLNKTDTSKIKQEIMSCNEKESLAKIVTEIKRLEKINEFIETVNKGILERAGFFSSDPHKKIEAIETAFQQLSIEDKNKLATLTEIEINNELSKEKDKESGIGKLLKAIQHKRGFIPIRSATSFTFFKSEISHLKHDLDEINTPIQTL